MRMKILWALLLCASSWWSAHAQQLERQVLSAQGQSSFKGSVHLDWTLGEIATAQLDFPNGKLTEGFHQGFLKVEPVKDLAFIAPTSTTSQALQVKVFPNPVSAVLNVKLAEHEKGSTFLTIRSLDGRRILPQRELFSSSTTEIDLRSYPAGLYVLQIQDEDGNLLKTFKITKTQ